VAAFLKGKDSDVDSMRTGRISNMSKTIRVRDPMAGERQNIGPIFAFYAALCKNNAGALRPIFID